MKNIIFLAVMILFLSACTAPTAAVRQGGAAYEYSRTTSPYALPEGAMACVDTCYIKVNSVKESEGGAEIGIDRECSATLRLIGGQTNGNEAEAIVPLFGQLLNKFPNLSVPGPVGAAGR